MQSGNNSIISETSSKFNEESRQKIDSLMNAFEELGWDNQKDLTQDEIRYFLNNHSKDGQFDLTLAQKLFSILDVDDQNRISGEDFIKGYLQFEADLKKNNDEFNKKFINEQNNLNNLEEQCRLYKTEKLSPEGFCENAKITVEITDVNIQREIEGIKGIIIKVIYNDVIEEKKLMINNKNNNNLVVNQKFEFKPTSRRDRFEFIMIKVDENNIESEIGSKRFPLNEITSQEEYIVQITIPEIDKNENDEKVAAFINCKIVLFWSDYEFFEEKKKKSEQKLKKLNDALNLTNYYVQKIREVYGELKNDSIYNNTYNLINNNTDNRITQDNNNNKYVGNKKVLMHNNIPINSNDNYMGNSTGNVDNFRKKNEIEEKYGINEDNVILEPEMDVVQFKGKNAVRFFGLCVIFLAMIGSLKRPDYPNILEGIFILLCCAFGTNSGIKNALKWFKYIFIGDLILIFYNFFWLVAHYEYIWIDSYTGGRENFIGFLSVLGCVCNILVTSFLGVLLFKQYSTIKNIQEESLNN